MLTSLVLSVGMFAAGECQLNVDEQTVRQLNRGNAVAAVFLLSLLAAPVPLLLDGVNDDDVGLALGALGAAGVAGAGFVVGGSCYAVGGVVALGMAIAREEGERVEQETYTIIAIATAGMLAGAALMVGGLAILAVTPFVVAGIIPGIASISGAVLMGGTSLLGFAFAAGEGRKQTWSRVDQWSVAASLAAALLGATTGYAIATQMEMHSAP